MKTWEVWSEGYLATGMEGVPAPAQKLGEAQAETFKDACDLVCSSSTFQVRQGNYDPVRLTVWGCRLFDNKEEAQKSFG
jgi:hypothetical protein